MTFYDTLVYLVLAAAMFNFMDCFVVWEIGRSYQAGALVEVLVKPIDYQIYLFFSLFGNSVVAFVITFVPTFIIIYFVTKGSFELGINLLLFMISVCIAIIVNYCVDFIVGIICFYTQSVWGVNIMKEVVVSLLSGATIPLAFFPEKLQMIVMFIARKLFWKRSMRILTVNGG